MSETLSELLAGIAKRQPASLAFEFGTRCTTYAELDGGSTRAATALLASGVEPGQRIGYLGKNSDRYFELLFAAAKAGVVLVPIGWRLTAPEIEFLIDDARIGLLFIEPNFHSTATRLAQGRPLQLVSTEGAVHECPAYQEWRESGDPSRPMPVVEAAWPVIQLYTSGTTGRPKGAMLSHANIFPLRPLSAAANIEWDRWDPEDVSLLTMPIAHISGTGWGLVALYNGAKSIVMPEFDAGVILRAVSNERISRVFLVPTAVQAVLRHPDAAQSDFSRLRYILYGASPIPLGLLREAMAVLGCEFVQNYGMTETCGTIVALPPEDHSPAGNERMKSAGKALPGVELRIVDEELEPVPARTIGEILIKSPTTMIGYWNRPDATREALVDGWMRTGDAGYLDEDGYLFVQDRLKDMIITGGENVYPAEVESTLHSYPGIEDVAIIGVPDERWGEAVTAIVVPTAKGVDEKALLLWARERLAAYKVPKRVILTDALPRNPNGKILRRLLREPFWTGKGRAVN
ncbi:fatty acid--CoA ligase [Novosphingobium sp. HII-3]|uniref:fatty acid--CoA ligase n=1 Tax=Novosphingobium sp. HII-3 TaxID=2075565 RepID=UPI000CD9FD8F|nr:fatty acid--CoA ligase [Novosphingobium sp. HII-3]